MGKFVRVLGLFVWGMIASICTVVADSRPLVYEIDIQKGDIALNCQKISIN